MSQALLKASRYVLAVAAFGMATSCIPSRGAVSMRVEREANTPKDASVTIDEQYIGPLGYVARRGVRLPVGEHRVTVEREGYFPFDAIVEADRKPIRLQVELTPIPD